MKKKLLAVLLCVAMVAAMAVGCGGGKDSGESKDEGKKSDLNIGVFYYTYADTYIASVRTALDKKLDDMGVKYQDYDGSTQIIDKAKAADVPVIFFNRAVEDEKSEEGTILGSYEKCAFVGTDAPEAGHMQGEMIGDYVVENFDTVDLNGDGKISYAMFMGQLGNAEAIYRTQFAVEDANKKLEEAGKPALEFFDPANTDKYQVDQDGAWSATAANNYMTTNLSQYNEGNNNMIELIICNNDGMAEGAVAALNDKGYNTGDPAKTIPVFGVDATDAAKKLIADGKMVGTIKQDAEGMAACIAQLTQNTADGKELVDGVEKDMISEKVANKIFIPYGIYTGEE